MIADKNTNGPAVARRPARASDFAVPACYWITAAGALNGSVGAAALARYQTAFE